MVVFHSLVCGLGDQSADRVWDVSSWVFVWLWGISDLVEKCSVSLAAVKGQAVEACSFPEQLGPPWCSVWTRKKEALAWWEGGSGAGLQLR